MTKVTYSRNEENVVLKHLLRELAVPLEMREWSWSRQGLTNFRRQRAKSKRTDNKWNRMRIRPLRLANDYQHSGEEE